MKSYQCFLIDNVPLFFKKSLIEFNDFTELFVCEDDNGQTYVAFYADLFSELYYVVPQSKKLIEDVTSRKVPLRKLFECESYWEVVNGGSIDKDIVTKKNGNEMNEDYLPDENIYLG